MDELPFKLGTKSYRIAEDILGYEREITTDERETLAKKHDTTKSYVYDVTSTLRKEDLYPPKKRTEKGDIENIDSGNVKVEGDIEKPTKPRSLDRTEIDKLDRIGREQKGENYFPLSELEAFSNALTKMGVPQEVIQKASLDTNRKKKARILGQPRTIDKETSTEESEEDYYDDDELAYGPQPTPDEEPPEEVPIRSPYTIGRKIELYAKNIVLLDLAKQGAFGGALMNFDGSLADFVNIIIDDYFKKVHHIAMGVIPITEPYERYL